MQFVFFAVIHGRNVDGKTVLAVVQADGLLQLQIALKDTTLVARNDILIIYSQIGEHDVSLQIVGDLLLAADAQ